VSAAQGAVLVRRPEQPTLSIEDRRILQSALNGLVEARRLLDLAGKSGA
jgi:RNA polymerase-interacting CarD/CdnL/TRCF family regulator